MIVKATKSQSMPSNVAVGWSVEELMSGTERS